MALPSNVVAARAGLLARIKLVFDLLLGVALYLSGAPLPFLIAPALDIVLLWPYQRFVTRAPATLTLGMLTLSGVLLALAPLGLDAVGVALWVLYPLLPLGAGFVLGRRNLLWRMAAITTGIAVLGSYPYLAGDRPLAFDSVSLLTLLGALAATTWLASWLIARTLRPETGTRDILGPSLTVVRGVLVVPFNWVVGGLRSDALRVELLDIEHKHNPRWLVLDLAPAGDLGRRDLQAVERAVDAVTTPRCTVVLARPPVDALGHLDFAHPQAGRVERFATVPQAVEAGLRRLGWSQQAEQPERIVTLL